MQKNKKIFFVADSSSIHTAKWVDYFVEKYDVYLATFSKENKTKCENVFFLSNKNIKKKGGNYHYLLKILELSKLFDKIKPDVINAHFSYSLGFVSLLAKKISKSDAKLTVVCHGSDILNTPSPKFLFKQINKYVLDNASKIFAVSDQIKDEIEKLQINMDKVFVGQYGVDVLNIDNEKDIDIISIRSYVPNSRIKFLLEGLTKLSNYRGLNIIFVLPGIGEAELIELKKKYPMIKFFKYLEYNKLINLLKKSKIYISATKSDGASLSLLESMSAGCVPVVSNICANRSWVIDGINGFLFNNKMEFIEKLQFVLDNYSKINQKIFCLNKDIVSTKAVYKEQMQKIERFLLK